MAQPSQALCTSNPVVQPKQNAAIVTGNIYADGTKPIAGVFVRVAGTNVSVRTNEEGQFVILAFFGAKTPVLLISGQGFASEEVALSDGPVPMAVVLAAASELE